YVEVDDDGLVATQCEAGTNGGAGGGLAHTPLAGSNHENLGQGVSPLKISRGRCPGKMQKTATVKESCSENDGKYPLKTGDVQHVTGQADLHAGAPQRVAAQVFADLVLAGDGDHFRGHLLAENARFGIAFDAGQGSAAHGAVHMDVAIGQKFRTRADRAGHHQVAALGVDLLAAAYWRSDDAGRAHLGFEDGWRGWGWLGLL